MAEGFEFELVSPERRLAAGPATAVVIPGVAGDLTAMPAHAPFLTVLRPGFVAISTGAGTTEYFVTGGFAEVSPGVVSILAEEAVEKSALTRARLDGWITAAEAALAAASEESRAALALRLNDLRGVAATA